MELKFQYDNLDDIPEQIESFRELFTERNGKFQLTGVAGLPSAGSIKTLEESLRKERNDHKGVRDQLAQWKDLGEFEAVQKQIDRVPELELAAKNGSVKEHELEELVERRLASRLAPTQREMNKLKKANEEQAQQITNFVTTERRRKIDDAVATAATKFNMLPGAIDDAKMHARGSFEISEAGEVITRDGVGVAQGLPVDEWLQELKPSKGHWFPGSKGSGAGDKNAPGNLGLGDTACFERETYDLDAVMAYQKQHGPDKALSAAKRAGSQVVGQVPPAKQPTG